MKITKHLNPKMKIVLILFALIFIAFVIIQLFAMRGQRNIETYPYVVNKNMTHLR